MLREVLHKAMFSKLSGYTRLDARQAQRSPFKQWDGEPIIHRYVSHRDLPHDGAVRCPGGSEFPADVVILAVTKESHRESRGELLGFRVGRSDQVHVAKSRGDQRVASSRLKGRRRVVGLV